MDKKTESRAALLIKTIFPVSRLVEEFSFSRVFDSILELSSFPIRFKNGSDNMIDTWESTPKRIRPKVFISRHGFIIKYPSHLTDGELNRLSPYIVKLGLRAGFIDTERPILSHDHIKRTITCFSQYMLDDFITDLSIRLREVMPEMKANPLYIDPIKTKTPNMFLVDIRGSYVGKSRKFKTIGRIQQREMIQGELNPKIIDIIKTIENASPVDIQFQNWEWSKEGCRLLLRFKFCSVSNTNVTELVKKIWRLTVYCLFSSVRKSFSGPHY